MNILNKITKKNLMLNKHRTIVTIIGIMLSCALITAVSTFLSSARNTLLQRNKTETGNYHIKISNMQNKDMQKAIENVEVKNYGISQGVGYAYLKGSTNEYKPYIYIDAMNNFYLDNSGLKLVSGRMPENSSELVISQHIETNGKVKYNLGDKIILDVGTRRTDSKILNQYDPYNEDNLSNYSESIVNTIPKEYTVVGVIQRSSIEPLDAAGYLVITYLDKINPNEKSDVKIFLKNPKNIQKYEDNVLGKQSDDELKGYNYDENREFLALEGVIENGVTMYTLIIIVAIIITVIIITSIVVIRNSFYISITERIKEYGILSSIGATSKQIKKNVKYEGFILGLIAIPLGVIIGILAVFIVLKLVSHILANYLNGIIFKLDVSYIAILLSVILSAITIYVSSLKPAKKASKISPIDAINLSHEIKLNNKKLKVSKLFKKIFGIEGTIALKNLKRSKQKYKTTIISIFISVIIFITMDSVILYGFKYEDLYYVNMQYNILVRDLTNKTAKATEEYFDKIKKLDNINSYSISKQLYLDIDQKYINSEIPGATLNKGYVNVISLGKEEFERYCKKIDVTIQDNEAILVDKALYYKPDKKKYELNFLNLNEGQTIDGIDDNNSTLSLKIKKRTDILPMAITETQKNTAYLIVSDDYIEKYNYAVYYMYINSNNPTKLEENIQKVDTSMHNNVFNIDKEKKENDAMLLVVSIFAYGFIGVISIIGITNIFNTITTNVALRKKEFAILQSIGMTSKQFSKMMNYESIIYGFRSLLLGIPIGTLISYMIYKAISNSIITAYKFPLKSILISIIFVFAIIFITMSYSTKKIKRQNIIDAIRDENI